MILRNGRSGGKKEAGISSIALVVIILAVAVFAFWYISSSSSNIGMGGSNVEIITLQSYSFNATTSTLTFTLNNPDASTNVNSVTVTVAGNSTGYSCAGNFAVVKAGGPSAESVTTESCSVSGVNFKEGETLHFVVDFSDGQSISSGGCSIIASLCY